MAFSNTPNQIVWKILQGKDLVLQLRISSEIFRKFTPEVIFFQKELDIALERFNGRIKALQAEAKVVDSEKKKEKMTDEKKAVILKMQEEEKKEEGGGFNEN